MKVDVFRLRVLSTFAPMFTGSRAVDPENNRLTQGVESTSNEAVPDVRRSCSSSHAEIEWSHEMSR